MLIKLLPKILAYDVHEELKTNNYNPSSLYDSDYDRMRQYLVSKYNELKNKIVENNRKKYILDVKFGFELYNYLKELDFTVRNAENDQFWIYMSLKVLPDLVHDRFPNNFGDHAYKNNVRIWLKTLWWYIFLSFQNNNVDDTKSLLLIDNRMKDDIILNLVERTGELGVNVTVYRNIMKYYGSMPKSILDDLENKIKNRNSSDTFFRNIMKLNTAKTILIEPSLYKGGEEGYVKSLFNELGYQI